MRDITISLCIPVMNRTMDLVMVMPSIIKAANASPPVEIVILDYNSQDDLEDYVNLLKNYGVGWVHNGNRIVHAKYTGQNKHFHMAHSRNLSVLAAIGEYVVISCADVKLDEDFFSSIRERIEEYYPDVIQFKDEVGVVCIKRNEFINAGGFDERFELYGKEDKDLFLRLVRRGAKLVNIPSKKFYAIFTPDEVKVRNYRLKIGKRQMDQIAKVIYYENIEKQLKVANPDGWGSWL